MKTFFDLGKKVRCDGYYKKAKDGVFIACFDKNGYITSGTNKNEIDSEDFYDTFVNVLHCDRVSVEKLWNNPANKVEESF